MIRRFRLRFPLIEPGLLELILIFGADCLALVSIELAVFVRIVLREKVLP